MAWLPSVSLPRSGSLGPFPPATGVVSAPSRASRRAETSTTNSGSPGQSTVSPALHRHHPVVGDITIDYETMPRPADPGRVPNLNSVEPVRRRHDPARPLGSHHARRHRIRRPPGLHHPGKAVRRLHLTKRARYRRAIIGNSPRSRGGHSRVRPVRHHGVLLRLPFLQGAVAGGPRQSRRAHRLVGTLNLARDHMFSAQTGHHHGDG